MMKFILSLFLLTALVACKKNSNRGNPYDKWENTSKGPVISDKPIDPNSIEGLHKNIFKPTCSNSGCHDGNFEPDFRSIESSYNSLINRLSTNTDPNNSQFNLRVVPGDAAKSMLLHRLNVFIPGSQGIMPLTTDPGSDWTAKKNEYIQNISNWIKAGAKDQFGNAANSIDFIPQIGGLIAFADGSNTPLTRNGYNPLAVPSGTNSLKIWVAYTDDKTPVNQFSGTKINFSLNPNKYDSTKVQNMVLESNPFNAKGVAGSNLDYWHSININIADIGTSGDVIWVRTETSDKVNPKVFIPSSSTSFNFVKHFALRLN
jgi:hypothetical protein